VETIFAGDEDLFKPIRPVRGLTDRNFKQFIGMLNGQEATNEAVQQFRGMVGGLSATSLGFAEEGLQNPGLTRVA